MIGWIASVLERPLVVGTREVERRDAIVVLGAPLWPGDRLSPIVAERVAAAVELYRLGGAPLVIATGGVTSGVRAEADAMAERLAEAGIAALVERASRSTAENARRTAELAGDRVRTVWVVTQPFHERRAVRLFRGAGFDARAWHIANSLEYRDRVRATRWLLREYAAWGKLYFTGRC
ncbi:MAG: YdcF family protein [Deltaproteobacteria bacterium]|nr:YdcF family protein [Deltaproteobacteria bacterium]